MTTNTDNCFYRMCKNVMSVCVCANNYYDKNYEDQFANLQQKKATTTTNK